MFKDTIIATVEARMRSSRMPGKVLLPLAGKPALERLVERVRRSTYVDDVVVATTVNPEDEAIVEHCRKMECRCFRGSEDDVLSRVLGAARDARADVIVELTGDCPLVDHRHIDSVIELFYSDRYDYAANIIERSFPDGFDVQVFPVRVLEQVDGLTDDSIDRVHVSYYIYTHPQQFKLANQNATGDMVWPDLGLTLDEQADYELIGRIYAELLPEWEDFSAFDVIGLLKRKPELLHINAHVRRKSPQEG